MILHVFTLLITAVAAVTSTDPLLSFLVIGDWGGLPFFPYTTPIETSVSKQLDKVATAKKSQFVLALGDNFYFDGVKNVDDPRFKETYEEVFKYPSLDIDWYFVAGNHDHNGNVSAQIEYSNKESRWNFPNFYYELNFKIPSSSSTIDIIMIDTIQLCGNSDSDFLYLLPMGPDNKDKAETQWQWLEERIANSKADYLLVAGHYPVYSIAEHGPTPLLVSRLDPLLHQYHATAYLSGHDHNLQHLEFGPAGQKVDYFVSGAANFVDWSRSHADAVPPGSSKFYWANLLELGGFATIDATPQNMTLTFIDAKGAVLYSHTMLPRKL